MKLSSLIKLLSGQLPAAGYAAEIADELEIYIKGLATRGAAAPVCVIEDADVLLDRVGLGRLCQLFASGELTSQELAYTADALQMAERVGFSDQEIADDLAECTDPEINGQFTVTRALEIASRGAAA